MVSFTDYLIFMAEDVGQDVQRLQASITAIDTQIQQRTAPLIRQREMLQKQLMVQQKKQSADQSNDQDQNGQQAGQQPGMTANKTTTPGSAGAATPGSGSMRT